MRSFGPKAYYNPSSNQLPPNWGSYLFALGIEPQIGIYGARYLPTGGWLIFYH